MACMCLIYLPIYLFIYLFTMENAWDWSFYFFDLHELIFYVILFYFYVLIFSTFFFILKIHDF